MEIKSISKRTRLRRACKLLLCAVLTIPATSLYAQKKVKVSEEEIQPRCKDIPLDQRIRLTVARFNVTTPNTGGEFGANMATQLTNALQEINCFNVLGRQADNKDLTDEADFGKSEYADKNTAVTKGKMKSAQIIVTGEITEYNLDTKTARYAVVKTSKQTMKLGFIIQIRNAETREVLFSKSFNVEGKSGGGTDIGVGKLSMGGGSSNNPAVANALEQGIKEAVEYIADQKDKMAENMNPPAAAK